MSILAPTKRVLLIGDEGVSLFLVKGKRARRRASISWQEKEFVTLLRDELRKRERNVPVVLLFDMLDQQYRKEVIPKSNLFDRGKIMKRRLTAVFPKIRVRAAMPLKEKAEGEDGMLHLFAGLPTNRRMESVYEAVITAHVPIDGLVLLPIESASLVDKVAKAAFPKAPDGPRWAVMIGRHETGGLRQIVTRDGELALTRLTPIQRDPDSEDEPNIAPDVEREFAATVSYIKRFGYNPGDRLDVIIICSQRVEDQLKAGDSFTEEHTLFCRPETAARLASLRHADETGPAFNDKLHAAWAGSKHRFTLPMHTPVLDRINKPRQIARSALALLILGALVIGSYGGYRYILLSDAQSDVSIEQQKKRQLQAEYERKAKVFEQLPNDPHEVKAILTVHENLQKLTTDPYMMIRKILAGMDERLRLESIRVEPRAEDLTYSNANDEGQRFDDEGNPIAFAPEIKTSVTFLFPGTQDPAIGARAVEDFVDRMRIQNPGKRIIIEQQVGDLSITDTLSDQMTNLIDGDVERSPPPLYAEVVITGALR